MTLPFMPGHISPPKRIMEARYWYLYFPLSFSLTTL